MADKAKAVVRREFRFGVGEWYGRPFTELLPDERKHLAEIQYMPEGERPSQPCPFLSRAGVTVSCWKAGGVCSIRKYERVAETGEVSVSAEEGALRTTCPSRFEEDGEIYRWIGEVIFGRPEAVPIGSMNFRDLGTFDNVLVVPNTQPLEWCAIEKQAVYFSGDRMNRDFEGILLHEERGLPFPAGKRRPDYRSSGPKRLMPQLQMKVPWFRRWGKKMAVVVDRDFFTEVIGNMRTVEEIPNCEVAWFVVTYENFKLRKDRVFLTTLEESVQSLVSGAGLRLSDFEERILSRLARLGPSPS